MAVDITDTAALVQAYVANDDPAAQQSDMEAIVSLYAQADMTPHIAFEVTQLALQRLSIEDKRDLFIGLATRLDAPLLHAVALGLGQLADAQDLRNAINTFSPPWVREAFNRSLDPQADANAESARRRYMASERLTGEAATAASYRLFMRQPELMAQPIINAHYRSFPAGTPLPMQGRTEISNQVARLLGWERRLPAAAAAPDCLLQHAMLGCITPSASAPAQTLDPAALSKTTDLYPNSPHEQARRAAIVEQIVAIGGLSPQVTAIPAVFALPETGLVKTILFRVGSPDGSRLVDAEGRAYAGIDDFTHSNHLPAQGVKLVLPRDDTPQPDAHGNIPIAACDARIESTFEQMRRVGHLDQAAIGLGLATTGGVIWASGGTAAPPVLAALKVSTASGLLYGTATSIGRVHDLSTHGGDLTSPAALLDEANIVLSVAGLGQLSAGALGLRLPATVNGALAGGNLGTLAASSFYLMSQWKHLPPDQQLEQGATQATTLMAAAASHTLPGYIASTRTRPQQLGLVWAESALGTAAMTGTAGTLLALGVLPDASLTGPLSYIPRNLAGAGRAQAARMIQDHLTQLQQGTSPHEHLDWLNQHLIGDRSRLLGIPAGIGKLYESALTTLRENLAAQQPLDPNALGVLKLAPASVLSISTLSGKLNEAIYLSTLSCSLATGASWFADHGFHLSDPLTTTRTLFGFTNALTSMRLLGNRFALANQVPDFAQSWVIRHSQKAIGTAWIGASMSWVAADLPQATSPMGIARLSMDAAFALGAAGVLRDSIRPGTRHLIDPAVLLGMAVAARFTLVLMSRSSEPQPANEVQK